MTERTTPLLGLACETCGHVEGLHANPATHIQGSSACATCDCTRYVGESDRTGKLEPAEPVMTGEDDYSVDPFQCLPPTRKNFPSVAHALTYYEARANKARQAERLLAHGSLLARTVVEHAQAAAKQVRSLSRVELLKLGVSEEAIAELQTIIDAPDQLGAALVPMVETFGKAAELYDARATMLEQACIAMIAQLRRQGELS